MKSPAVVAAVKTFAFAALAAFFTSPAIAQRESFDATVIRKADSIATEMSRNSSAPGVARRGRSAEGGWLLFTASREAISFQNIYFKLDSTELRDRASELQVDEIAAAMKSPRLKNAHFLLEGHTCDLGEDEYNLDLSARRARAIRALLARKGVSSDRLVVLGFGETELVEHVRRADTPAEAEAKRMKNRRVVLRRLIPETKPIR